MFVYNLSSTGIRKKLNVTECMTLWSPDTNPEIARSDPNHQTRKQKQMSSGRTYLNDTKSTCPQCSRVLDAKIAEEGRRIYLEKACPEHGSFRSLVWSDSDQYKSSSRYGKPGKKHLIRNYAAEVSKGCPHDCGICSDHKQHTCFALVELTNRCNLDCPVCYASANDLLLQEPTMEKLEEMFTFILSCEIYPPTLQLTGGEPTVRKDVVDIVKIAKELGFTDITMSTNGVVLAEDPTLARRLAGAGLSEVSLQFDGTTDDVYVKIRGRPLLSTKLRAVSNAQSGGLCVSVAAALVPGVNTNQIGDIIRFAKERRLDGVALAPVTYAGRYPKSAFNPESRMTIPDVLRAVESQTDGELKGKDFVPVPCPDTRCSTMTYAFNTPDGLVPLTRVCDVSSHLDSLLYGERVVNGELVRDSLESLWSMSAVPGSARVMEGIRNCSPTDLAEKNKCMSISIHGFQDLWNFDVERVKKCCIHVVTADRKLIPFCVYNNIYRCVTPAADSRSREGSVISNQKLD